LKDFSHIPKKIINELFIELPMTQMGSPFIDVILIANLLVFLAGQDVKVVHQSLKVRDFINKSIRIAKQKWVKEKAVID